jgi:UTP--glucose-1-phosphate uridylyltransferase
MKIRKAVFPVAGLGTRFLPATKAMPKEMLPVVDKPLIQYAVEEALAAGIEQIIFVTGKGKEALEDHFDRSVELERTLVAKGNDQQLSAIEELVPSSGTIIYTRQSQPLGLGHAIWCTRDIVGDEPFAVLLADDLILSQTPVLSQMVAQFNKLQAPIIAAINVEPQETDKYGILDIENNSDNPARIYGMIEKPKPEAAPSTKAIIGRYILPPEIFPVLGRKKQGAGGEIQLTDAMALLLNKQAFYAFTFEGTRFDCGTKTGFQMANISFAMEHPEIKRDQLLSFLRSTLQET